MRISDWSSDVCSSDLLGWAKVWRCSRAKSTGATWRPDCRTLRISGCSHLGSCDLERRDTRSCPSARSGFAQVGKCGSLIDIEKSWLHPRGRCSRSEERTPELQSLMCKLYAVFRL